MGSRKNASRQKILNLKQQNADEIDKSRANCDQKRVFLFSSHDPSWWDYHWRRDPEDPRRPVQECGQLSTCQATGKAAVKVNCADASPSAIRGSEERKAPQILLSHAVITFQPVHESHMQIELTFTNKGKVPVTERQTVYIEFDDAVGQNHIRRPLPHVDLQKLAPGATTTFTDQFLAPWLRPGRYFVWLWIPSVDVVHKFDVQYNLLLGNSGMADSTNGLNRITGEDRLTDSGCRTAMQML